MKLTELPPKVEFMYIAMTKVAIYLKEMGEGKKEFIEFADAVWDSMELTPLDELDKIISEKMRKDTKLHIKKYMESMKENER